MLPFFKSSTTQVVIPEFLVGNPVFQVASTKTSSFPNGSVGNPRPGDFPDSRQRHSEMTTWPRDKTFIGRLLIRILNQHSSLPRLPFLVDGPLVAGSSISTDIPLPPPGS